MCDVEISPKKSKMCPSGQKIFTTAMIAPEATCAHFVKRKKRLCKMTVAKGKQFCGEHEPPTTLDDGAHPKDSNRIPCPLDPKHTVYKRKLQKHLRICNARQKEDIPAYSVKGINAGDTALDQELEKSSQLKLSELDDAEFYRIIQKVEELYAKYVEGNIQTLECQHKSLDLELAKEEYGKESRKHLLQTAALLGILEQEQQLCDDTSFIEFGAGKGQLAFYLAKTVEEKKNAHVVLLDRMTLRHKKDNKIEDKSLVHRIRVDIADFHMRQLELLQSSNRLVALSKHLCGAATDLTLRCITQALNECSPTAGETKRFFPQTEFVMIALCCHHRCDWASFVGKEFFRSNAVSPREFIVITKMVSWAICGTGMSRERRRMVSEQQKPLSTEEQRDSVAHQRLSLKERERIGFMCKRVLDYARLMYLREHQFEASLKYYVGRDVTLENVCLLAKKIK